MWFGSSDWRKPALICYQPSTDGMKMYTRFVNQDGTALTAQGVRCLEEDVAGKRRLGTGAGPRMLTAPDIADGSETFTQVKVARNDGTNYADYLLDGISISAIAIDGGGRKWFGTDGSGVFLISADNMTQLQHFTTDNSPLLSNTIESIAVDGTSGEVFFGTDKGLCSYMSDASQASDKMDKDTRRLADSIIEEANRNNAIALPVGLAFAESLKERPDLVLHQADKSHPTAAGSYLYGALIYSLLFKASPEGLDFLGECEKTLRPEDAAYLQQLAWRVATEFYGWK